MAVCAHDCGSHSPSIGNVSCVSLAIEEMAAFVEWRELLDDEDRNTALFRQACSLFVDMSSSPDYPFYQFMRDSLKVFFATRGNTEGSDTESSHESAEPKEDTAVSVSSSQDVNSIAKSVLNMRLFTRDINMLR